MNTDYAYPRTAQEAVESAVTAATRKSILTYHSRLSGRNVGPSHDPFKEPQGQSRLVYLDWLAKDRQWQEQQANLAYRERCLREGSLAPWPFLEGAIKSIR